MRNIPQTVLARTPVVEPEAQAFLEKLQSQGGPPLPELPAAEARAALADIQSGPVSKPPVDYENRTIPLGAKGKVTLHIVRPKGAAGTLPAIMYFHGGGWMMGDRETHDRLLREIAHGVRASVIFVEYTRSPEARFPVAVEEAYAATQWVTENGSVINVDPARLVVAGDSVGGNLAAVVALLAKERGGPNIHLQILFYPVTDADFDSPSYQQFAQGYYLTRDGMKRFWNHYAPDPASRMQVTASPLRASLEQLRDLPPALVITGECDVLRDEGEAYARKMMRAGVRVTAMRFLGAIHDFVMLNDLAGTPAARSAVTQAVDAARAVFSQ